MKASTGLSEVSKTQRLLSCSSNAGPTDDVSPPRFLADCMLGRLARWLRIVGFDTMYFRKISDSELLSLHQESGRILLTRDTGLVRSTGVGPHLFVQDDHWEAQFREVLTNLSLTPSQERMFTRCIRCNQLLEALPHTDIVGKVPDFVASTQTMFQGCSACGKIYWHGTHRDHASRVVARLCSEIGIQRTDRGGHERG